MGMTNTQLYALAKSYLGDGGSRFRQFCGLPSNAAWCAAFVSYIFAKGGDASLFYGGKKVVYVPSAQTWCRANLAEIPLYMAMPMDIITFDWNSNGVPDHIGFVKARKSDTEIYTIEGNTSGGIVANRVRPAKYISGCFRIQFAPSSSWSADKSLAIDGECGYNTIAVLQKVLKKKGCYSDKVDAILGKNTVKGIQKLCGVAQDGSWGQKTSKAFQKLLGVSADGWFGENSVKAMQKWLNKQNVSTPSTVKPVQKTIWDNANAYARKIANDNSYHYVSYSSASYTHQCPICTRRSYDKGWNCIGFAWSVWRHGAGIPCRCNCEVINDPTADKILRSNHETAVEIVKQKTGLSQVTVVSNGGKAIPLSSLRKGDIVLLYDGKSYYHTEYYMGDSKFADSTQTRSDNIKADMSMSKTQQADIKIAIRYTGKVVI